MKYPAKIHIGFQEGTCPLNCPKCYAFGKNATREKEIRKMPIEKAYRLIDEIALMEVRPKIQPHIYTEPFANKDLKKIILRCREKDIPMSIISNGILINEDWIDFLVENTNRNCTISFSLDALTQEVYEKVRGKYRLEEIEEKINKLIFKRRNSGPRIGVNFVVEEDNIDEATLFLDKWKYVVDAVRISVVFNEKKQVHEIFRDMKRGANIFQISQNTIMKECGYLNKEMTIDTGGEVRYCSQDAFGDTYLGNVFEEGILSIWNGKLMQDCRKRQKEGLLSSKDFCYKCEYCVLASVDNKREIDDFIIHESEYSFYYNKKSEYTK